MACRGYWPPEYIKHQIISEEFDIFSLGVLIVKIMVGPENYFSTVEMTTRSSVRHVRIKFFSISTLDVLRLTFVEHSNINFNVGGT
jgi:hypothetical protein